MHWWSTTLTVHAKQKQPELLTVRNPRSNEINHFVLFSYVDTALKDWLFFNVFADIGCNGKIQLNDP